MSVSPINTEKSKLFSALSNVLRHKPMRPVVRLFTQLHVVLYRLTNGKAQIAKYPTLLLTVRGRRLESSVPYPSSIFRMASALSSPRPTQEVTKIQLGGSISSKVAKRLCK